MNELSEYLRFSTQLNGSTHHHYDLSEKIFNSEYFHDNDSESHTNDDNTAIYTQPQSKSTNQHQIETSISNHEIKVTQITLTENAEREITNLLNDTNFSNLLPIIKGMYISIFRFLLLVFDKFYSI